MKSFKYILVLFFLASLASCSSSSGNWGWYVIDPTTKSGLANIKFLIGGFGATILLSIIAAFISIILGLVVALPGFSNNFFLRSLNRIYVEFIRAIPLLPMLFWVFYGLPVIFQSLGLKIEIPIKSDRVKVFS